MRLLLALALAARLVAGQQQGAVDGPAANGPAPPAANATNITAANTTTTAANTTATPTTNLAANNAAPALNATAHPNATLSAEAPAAAGAGHCARTCVRREWRSLSPDERTAYLNAVRRLQATPAGAAAATNASTAAGRNARLQARQNAAPLNGPSEYDRLVKLHIDDASYAHGTNGFLPWHRAYVREYELALQRIDPSICGVYWNWALDSQAPEDSPLLSAEYFGGNGRGADNCVQDGAFAGHRAAYPSEHCLRRAYAYNGGLGAFQPIETVNRVISTVKDYTSFRKQVEGVLHPGPHNAFGGDMSLMSSPNDPLFFLHHTFVDYMWSRWQQRNGFGFPGQTDGVLASLTDYRVADVLDQRGLCYEYAELSEKDLGDSAVVPPPPPPTKTPREPRDSSQPLPDLTTITEIPANVTDDQRYAPTDRSNLAIVRYASPTPREWCEHNNIPYDEVAKYEEEFRGVCAQLNGIRGYVSPCSLLKRPTLQARIVQARKVQQFYVDVPDVGRIGVAYRDEVATADPYEAVASIQKKVFTCAPNVELPVEAYRASVQKLIGDSAFSGASDPIPISDMDNVRDNAAVSTSAPGILLAAASVLAVALVQL